MKRETFLHRLTTGKTLNRLYEEGGRAGIVKIWRYEDSFVLTWEECPIGEQYDESTYTKDLRESFPTTEALLAYLQEKGLFPEGFTP